MLQKIQMNPLQLLTFAKMLQLVQTKAMNPASVLISVAMDLCEDAAARPDEGDEPGVCPDLRGDGPVAGDELDADGVCPDLRGDGPVAGNELDADEDLLVDVTSEGTDADLCADQELPASSQ